MNPADLSQPRSWRGRWWLPAQPEAPATGVLSYRPESGLELILIGGFSAPQWEHFRTAPDQGRGWDGVLYGEAGGYEITLFDCIATNSVARGMDFFAGEVTEQTFIAHDALVGVHLESRNEPYLQGVEFAMQGLANWAPPDGLDLQIQFDDRFHPMGARATHEAVPDATAETKDGQLSLRRSWTMPRRGITREGAAITLAVHPSLRWSPPTGTVSLREALARVRKWSACVAFAHAAALPLVWVRFPTEVGHEYIDYYAHYASVASQVEPPKDLLFTSQDLGFAETLQAWEDVWDRFEHPLNIVAAAWSEARGTAEPNAILAVIAAEVFHQALKEPPPMSREERGRLVALMQAAVEPERREWVANIVPRGHSLKQRLDRLAARLNGLVGWTLIPSPEKWAKTARKVRNDIGHGGHTSESFEVVVALGVVTRAMIIVNTLIEMDFSEEHILDALRRNPELMHACQEAREYFR